MRNKIFRKITAVAAAALMAVSGITPSYAAEAPAQSAQTEADPGAEKAPDLTLAGVGTTTEAPQEKAEDGTEKQAKEAESNETQTEQAEQKETSEAQPQETDGAEAASPSRTLTAKLTATVRRKRVVFECSYSGSNGYQSYSGSLKVPFEKEEKCGLAIVKSSNLQNGTHSLAGAIFDVQKWTKSIRRLTRVR